MGCKKKKKNTINSFYCCIRAPKNNDTNGRSSPLGSARLTSDSAVPSSTALRLSTLPDGECPIQQPGVFSSRSAPKSPAESDRLDALEVSPSRRAVLHAHSSAPQKLSRLCFPRHQTCPAPNFSAAVGDPSWRLGVVAPSAPSAVGSASGRRPCAAVSDCSLSRPWYGFLCQTPGPYLSRHQRFLTPSFSLA